MTTGQVFTPTPTMTSTGTEAGLPSVVADGRWHEMVVDAFLSLGVGHVDWLYGGLCASCASTWWTRRPVSSS